MVRGRRSGADAYDAGDSAGPQFTVETVITVTLISVFSWVHAHFLDVREIAPLYAGLFAGLTVGVGMIVVIAALATASPYILFCSIVGAVLLNLILAINHRPGRYYG